jgi:hypothetical protein
MREVELADGTILEFPDNTPDAVMLSAGKRITLERAATAAPKEYAGFFGSMKEAATTLGAADEAAAFAANPTEENRQALLKAAESKYKTASFGLSPTEDLSVLGRNLEALKQTLGGTIGFLAAPAAAATAGAFVGGIGAPVAGYGTAAAQYGVQNIARQAQEQQAAIDAGRTPEELSLGKAAIATAGQTALDVGGGKVFGPLLSRFPLLKNLTIGGKSAEESVQVLADAVRKGKLEISPKGTFARGVGKGVAFEVPQETAQQVLELWQADVPTDQWKDELIQAGIGGGLLGGFGGGVQARYAAPRQQLQERKKRAFNLLVDKYMQKGVSPLMRSGPDMTKEQAAAQAREDIQTGNIDFEPARQLLLGYSPPRLTPDGSVRFSQDFLEEEDTDTPEKKVLDAARDRQEQAALGTLSGGLTGEELAAAREGNAIAPFRDALFPEGLYEDVPPEEAIQRLRAKTAGVSGEELANVRGGPRLDPREQFFSQAYAELETADPKEIRDVGGPAAWVSARVKELSVAPTTEETPASRYSVPTTPEALKALITQRVNQGLLDPRQVLPVLDALSQGVKAADAGRMFNQIIAENEDRGALPLIGGVFAATPKTKDTIVSNSFLDDLGIGRVNNYTSRALGKDLRNLVVGLPLSNPKVQEVLAEYASNPRLDNDVRSDIEKTLRAQGREQRVDIKRAVSNALDNSLIDERQAQQVLNARKMGLAPNIANTLLNTYVAENNFRKTSPTPLDQFGDVQEQERESNEAQFLATQDLIANKQLEQTQARRRGALVRALESRMENVQRRSMEGSYDPYIDITDAFAQELGLDPVTFTPTEEEQGYIAGAVRLALSKLPENERPQAVSPAEKTVTSERQLDELEQFIPERREETGEPIQPSLPGFGRRGEAAVEETAPELETQDFTLTDDFLTDTLGVSEKNNFTSRVLGKDLRDAVVGLPVSDPRVREALVKYVDNPRVGNVVRAKIEQLLGARDPNQLELFDPQSERTARIAEERDAIVAEIAKAYRAGNTDLVNSLIGRKILRSKIHFMTPKEVFSRVNRYLKDERSRTVDDVTLENKIAAQRVSAAEKSKASTLRDTDKVAINAALAEIDKLSTAQLTGMNAKDKIKLRNALRSRISIALQLLDNVRRKTKLVFNEAELTSKRKKPTTSPVTDIQSVLSTAESAVVSGDIEEARNNIAALKSYINNSSWETLFDVDPGFRSETTGKAAKLSEYTEDRVQSRADINRDDSEDSDIVYKTFRERLKARATAPAKNEAKKGNIVDLEGAEFLNVFQTKQPWRNKKRALDFLARARKGKDITAKQYKELVSGIEAGAKPHLQARAAVIYSILNDARAIAERNTPQVTTTSSSRERGYEELRSKVSEEQWSGILKKLKVDGATLTGAVDQVTYAKLATEVNNSIRKAELNGAKAALKEAVVQKLGDSERSKAIVAAFGKVLKGRSDNRKALRLRYDASGKVRFRRGYERAVGMLADDVISIVDNITKNWKSNLNIEVVQSVDDLPTNLAVQATAMGADGVKGLAIRDGNTVFIVANNVNNLADVIATLFHEALGHAGLARAFGARLDSILRSVYDTNAAYKQRADAWLAANEDAYVDENNRELRALEEVLAEESEQGRINPSIFARIIAAIKDFARRIGLDLDYTKADVASILAAAHDIVVEGGESRAPTLQETDPKVAFKIEKAAEVQEKLSRSRDADKLAKGAVELVDTFRDFGKTKDFLVENWNSLDIPATLGALAMMATADIRGVYGKRLPSIAKLDRIEIEHVLARNTLQTKLNNFIADKWQLFVNANPVAGDVLADLLRASAMVQYDPRKPKAKLSSAEKFVQGLYETLGKTAGGHALYGTLMDSGKADLHKEVDALFAAVKNEDLPGDIKDPATPKGALYEYVQGLRDKVAKLEVYFPESRFGKYTVAIGSEKDGNLESYTRDTRIERDRLRDALEKELRANKDPRINSVRMYDTPKEARDNISTASEKELKKIYAALGGEKVGPSSIETIKDAAFQLYMRTLPQTAALKDLEQRRKNITGGSVDVIRGYAAHKYSANNRLARMVYGPQMRNALAEIKLEADKVSDPQEKLRLNTVAGELNTRVNRSLDPRFTDDEFENGLDKLARLGSKAVFYNFLSSPKQFVVQFATIPMIAAPVLAARYGVSIPQMLTNMGQHLRLDRKELSLFNKDYSASRMKDPAARAAFSTEYDALNAGGFFDETRIAEAAAISKKPQMGGSVAARAARKVDHVLRFAFQTAESSVRKVIFTTAFEFEYAKAKKETKSPQEAQALARIRAIEATYKTAFNYSVWNRPRLFTANPILRTATQFMIFPMAMSSLLVESFKQLALSPLATVEEKRAAAKQFWGIMGMTAVFGGLTGLPMYAAITAALDIYAEAMGDDDDDDESNPLYRKNSDLWIKEWLIPNLFGSGSGLASTLGLSEEMGALLDRSLKYGPVSALTGLNIASSTSAANLPFMFFIDKDVSNKELETAFYDTMLGPTGALIKNYGKGISDMAKGDYIRGVEQFLPSVLKAPVAAMRYASEGNVARSGREVRGAEYYTAGRLFLQSLGFADTATFEKENALYEAAKVGYEIKEEKNALYEKLYAAYRKGDKERVDEIIEEDIFNGFNKRYPTLRISLDDISSSIQGRLRERMQSKPSAGLNIGPRGFDKFEREIMGKYADDK